MALGSLGRVFYVLPNVPFITYALVTTPTIQ
jgi:hypothetical protein